MSLRVSELSPHFAAAGQLTPDDMAILAANGFKTVINNRPDGEGGPEQPLSADIEKAAQAVGLHYWYHPVVGGQFTTEQVQAMAHFLKDCEEPVLAFCRSGARTTMLWQMAQQYDE